MLAETRLQKAKEVLRDYEKPQGLVSGLNMRTNAYSASSDKPFENNKLTFGLSALDSCLEDGLAINALHEVRAKYAKDIGAATGFVFSLLHQLFSHKHNHQKHISNRHIIWVVDPASKQECGTLYPRGLAQYGIDADQITFIRARDLHSAMWAVDEAANCQGLAAVIFQVKGNPTRFDMTATRRLMLRAQESNVFTCILRQSGEEEASAAATRWCIEHAPTLPSLTTPSVLKTKPDKLQTQDKIEEIETQNVRHVLSLERNRNGQTNRWLASWNITKRRFIHATQIKQPAISTPETQTFNSPAAYSGNRVTSFSDRPNSPPKMGQVVDFGRPPR